MSKLTHFNAAGEAHMVDLGDKEISDRRAVAAGWINLQVDTLNMVLAGTHKKGDVLGIARVAGIMAAKKTAELVPLCHPIALSSVELDLIPDKTNNRIECTATVCSRGQTGVEMEALTAVQIALLTIYDMCKAVERGMTMDNIRLLEKSGGRSGHWQRDSD